jgi:hypothetical protein
MVMVMVMMRRQSQMKRENNTPFPLDHFFFALPFGPVAAGAMMKI